MPSKGLDPPLGDPEWDRIRAEHTPSDVVEGPIPGVRLIASDVRAVKLTCSACGALSVFETLVAQPGGTPVTAERERVERLLRGDLRDAFDRVLRDHEVDQLPERFAAIAGESEALPLESEALWADLCDALVDAAIDVRVMGMRRAFDVALATVEERWDAEPTGPVGATSPAAVAVSPPAVSTPEVDVSAVEAAIANAQEAGVHGDYDALLAFARQSERHAATAVDRLRERRLREALLGDDRA